ncbi:hypothetical protein GGR57DRAFT_16954 [Xylariaceae sp. FL1272]|nr:hypothetical protein GGR57DRAFT_16954 [Xylariaceae sp. FL1272]
MHVLWNAGAWAVSVRAIGTQLGTLGKVGMLRVAGKVARLKQAEMLEIGEGKRVGGCRSIHPNALGRYRSCHDKSCLFHCPSLPYLRHLWGPREGSALCRCPAGCSTG